MKIKKPEFLHRLSPSKTILKLIAVLVISSIVVIGGYILFQNFISSPEPESAKPISTLTSNSNNINDDPTVKNIMDGINTRSQMAAKQNINVNTYNNNQRRAQDETNNEMVTIGRVKDINGTLQGNQPKTSNSDSVPQVLTSGNSAQMVNAGSQQAENDDTQKSAYKAQTKVALSFGGGGGSGQEQNASSPVTQALPNSNTVIAQQPTSPSIDNNLSNMKNRSTNTTDSAEYKPVTDGKGFYMQTGSNNSKNDLVATKASNRWTIKKGTYIPAILYGEINTDTPGPIRGFVRQNVYDSKSMKYVLIPKNSVLLGSYSTVVQYGQERVIAAWNTLILPDGVTEIKLEGQPGTDMAGAAGFNDLVNNHYWQLFGTSFVLSVITAGMEYNQQQYSNNYNGGQSFGNSLSQSTGQMFGNTATQILQKGINVQPTLEIRNGYLYNILLTQDVVMDGPVNVKVYN